jgi:hypothetical protein
MKTFIISILLLLCSSPAFSSGYPKDFNPRDVPHFHYPQYVGYDGVGTGEIWGKLEVKTQLFGVRAFPNNKVYLIPNTAFSGWYLEDVAYSIEHVDDDNALINYPPDLYKYTRETTTDSNGMYYFKNLPDGSYIVDAGIDTNEDSQPERERSTIIGYDINGDMVAGIERYRGYKIRADTLLVAAVGKVDSAHNLGFDQITGYEIMGEATCCKHEI